MSFLSSGGMVSFFELRNDSTSVYLFYFPILYISLKSKSVNEIHQQVNFENPMQRYIVRVYRESLIQEVWE